MSMKLLGGAELRKQLERLSKESEKTVKNGIARLGVAVRDDIAAEVGTSFEFSNSSTRNFLVKAWKYKYGTAADGIFRVIVYPLEKSRAILLRHIARQNITAQDNADLVVDGKIAIPAGESKTGISSPVKRDGRGRVPARWLPDRLLKQNRKGEARGWISDSGNVILVADELFRVAAAYVLKRVTKTEKRFDAHAIAEKTVRERAGAVFAAAIQESMRRAGIRDAKMRARR